MYINKTIMSEYICERCGNASRDGKPYAKKETLKIHLKSKTQKCEPLLSNISREDLLKKVSNPEYRKIVEKKKSPVTAKELFDKHSYYNKLNYGLDKIVFLSISSGGRVDNPPRHLIISIIIFSSFLRIV